MQLDFTKTATSTLQRITWARTYHTTKGFTIAGVPLPKVLISIRRGGRTWDRNILATTQIALVVALSKTSRSCNRLLVSSIQARCLTIQITLSMLYVSKMKEWLRVFRASEIVSRLTQPRLLRPRPTTASSTIVKTKKITLRCFRISLGTTSNRWF